MQQHNEFGFSLMLPNLKRIAENAAKEAGNTSVVNIKEGVNRAHRDVFKVKGKKTQYLQIPYDSMYDFVHQAELNGQNNAETDIKDVLVASIVLCQMQDWE